MASLGGMKNDDGTFIEFAWPGGYPVYYVEADGEVFCPSCASQEDAEPTIVACDINWEDSELFCDSCGKRIESAYTERD